MREAMKSELTFSISISLFTCSKSSL